MIVGQQDRRHLALPAVPGRRPGRVGGRLPGVGATSRRDAQDVPSAVARAWHEAVRRPRARRSSSCPATTGPPPPTTPSSPRPPRCGARRPPTPRPSTSWPTCWRRPASRRWSSGPTPTTPTPGPPWSRWPNGCGRRSGRRRSPPAPGFPQDHPLFAGHLPAGPRPPARGAGGPRRRAGGRRPGVPPVPLRAGAAGRTRARRSCWSPTTSRTPTTARCDLAVVAGPAAGLRGARGSACRTGGRHRRRRAQRAAVPAPPGGGRAAAGRPRDGRARRSGSRPTRWSSRRPRRAAPTCTACCPPGPRSDSSAPPWAGSASVCPPRSACGWPRPQRPWSPSSGDGSSLYGIQALWSAAHYDVRRAVRRAGQRPVRDHGPARRAARAARRRGRVRGGQHRGAWPKAWVARERGRDPRRPARGARRVVPTLADRTEPLVLEVAVVPDTTFEP